MYTSSTSTSPCHPSHKIYELQGGVGVPLHKIFVHVHQYDSMKAKQTLGYKIKGRWLEMVKVVWQNGGSYVYYIIFRASLIFSSTNA